MAERDDDPITEAIKALREQAQSAPAGDDGPPGVRLAIDNDAALLRQLAVKKRRVERLAERQDAKKQRK